MIRQNYEMGGESEPASQTPEGLFKLKIVNVADFVTSKLSELNDATLLEVRFKNPDYPEQEESQGPSEFVYDWTVSKLKDWTEKFKRESSPEAFQEILKGAPESYGGGSGAYGRYLEHRSEQMSYLNTYKVKEVKS